MITLGRPDRVDFVSKQLASVGITPQFVKGIKCDPGIIGCGLSHLRVLRQAPKPPFIVIEDDCAVTEDFRQQLDCQFYGDACYLGISTFGWDGQRVVNFGTKATVIWPHLFRIHNMCSSHAILYLNEKFVEAARKAITDSILTGIPFDIGLAELQGQLRVVTPNKPFFYQSALVGGHEEATRQALMPQPVSVKETHHVCL